MLSSHIASSARSRACSRASTASPSASSGTATAATAMGGAAAGVGVGGAAAPSAPSSVETPGPGVAASMGVAARDPTARSFVGVRRESAGPSKAASS